MSVERNDPDDEFVERWIGRVEKDDIPEVFENQSVNFVDKIVVEKLEKDEQTETAQSEWSHFYWQLRKISLKTFIISWGRFTSKLRHAIVLEIKNYKRVLRRQ